MGKTCRYFVVTGKVQGVWFRKSTQDKAQSLSLTGWVRNLDDGSVALVACGSVDDLTALEAWLRQGPPLAKVNLVQVSPANGDADWTQFEIKD